jgi:hypothetical protein
MDYYWIPFLVVLVLVGVPVLAYLVGLVLMKVSPPGAAPPAWAKVLAVPVVLAPKLLAMALPLALLPGVFPWHDYKMPDDNIRWLIPLFVYPYLAWIWTFPSESKPTASQQ